MRKLLVLLVLGAAAVFTVAIAVADTSTPPAEPSANEFVALASTGMDVDYEPLASPKAAVDKGDLIVEGTLIDVVEGIQLQYPNPAYTRQQAGTYATLVIDVTNVIDGELTGNRAYVQLAKSPVITTAELAKANQRPKVIAVLDDTTSWKPSPDVTVARPAALPRNAPLYAPYTDGIWLQASGDAEMYGIETDRTRLTPAWGNPRHVNDYSAALRDAARR